MVALATLWMFQDQTWTSTLWTRMSLKNNNWTTICSGTASRQPKKNPWWYNVAVHPASMKWMSAPFSENTDEVSWKRNIKFLFYSKYTVILKALQKLCFFWNLPYEGLLDKVHWEFRAEDYWKIDCGNFFANFYTRYLVLSISYGSYILEVAIRAVCNGYTS